MQLKHKTTGAIITIPEIGSYEHLASFELIKEVPKSTKSTAATSTRTKSTRTRKAADDGKGD